MGDSKAASNAPNHRVLDMPDELEEPTMSDAAVEAARKQAGEFLDRVKWDRAGLIDAMLAHTEGAVKAVEESLERELFQVEDDKGRLVNEVRGLTARLASAEAKRDEWKGAAMARDRGNNRLNRDLKACVAGYRELERERDILKAAVEQAHAALKRLIAHHNREDCGYRGGTDEACPVAAEAQAALTSAAGGRRE